MSEVLEEAELAVLGAVIATGGKCVDDIALTGEDFREPFRGDLFDQMRSMRQSGKHVDQLTLSDLYPKHAAFIWTLTEHAPFAHAVVSYADIVATHALRRRLAEAGAALAGLDPALSRSQMADRAVELVDTAVGSQQQKLRFVRDILPEVIDRLRGKETFTPTPWGELNTQIGGLRPGALYVIGARPGVGKTVIAAQLAAQLAQTGLVAFSSLEMTEHELVQRLIAERLLIMVGKIKDARMTDRDWELLMTRKAELEALNIAIDDRSGISAGEVRTFARQVSRKGRLVGVVVDYLQLMTSGGRMDRHLQVAEFSRQLKILAKDFQVPVIALSQLNRNSESTALAQPKLSDLRESGAIEQDADVVMLLRREGDDLAEHLVIDVAKNRHGQTGEVDLAWQGEFSRAVEWGS